MKTLSIRDVKKTYNLRQSRSVTEVVVLDGISLEVKRGEFVGVIGPNGCGKTTLLKLIIGVEKPEAGSVSVFGKTPAESRLGYVPQHYTNSLFPWLTAAENVAFADSPANGEAMQKALDRLKEVGIQHYANEYPYQLSGGIKQLVAIARAMMFRPDVFLFDEPLSALDYQNRFLIEQLFLNLRREGNTAILVTHDIESAVLLCDRIVILSEKPSRIKAILPVNLPEERNLETRFSLEFRIILREVFEILTGKTEAD